MEHSLEFMVQFSYDDETWAFLEDVADQKGCTMEEAAKGLLMFSLSKKGIIKYDEPFTDFS